MPVVTKQFVGRATGFAFLALLMRLGVPPFPPLRAAFLGASVALLAVSVFLLVVAATAWGVVLGREHEVGVRQESVR